MNLMAPSPASDPESDPAGAPRSDVTRAELSFAKAPDGRSYLTRQFLPYPFHITRPFYFDRDPVGMASIYLQSAAGGAYRGDRLALSVNLEEGAAAHVTTQASTLVHAGRGGITSLSQEITVGRDAFLEFLPDPLILMSGADCEVESELRLEEGARLLFSDAFLTHDPEAQGRPPKAFRSTLTLRGPSGRPLLVDRFRLGEDAMPLSRLGDLPCHASLLFVAPEADAALAAQLLQTLRLREGVYAGASTLETGPGLWLRLLARDGVALSTALLSVWQSLRRKVTGQEGEPRRK